MPKIKRDRADHYFSLWIRSRDAWTCQRCYKKYTPPAQALHASHFIGRGKEATRFEPANVTSLCYGCHQHFTAHPQEHYHWQVQRLGQKTVDKIILASNIYHKKERKLEAMYWRKKLLDDFGVKA